MVRIQGETDTTPGWATALGGAGMGVMGALNAKALAQQVENDKRRMDLLESEDARRNQYRALAEQELGLEFQKFGLLQEKAKRDQASLERRQALIASVFGPAMQQQRRGVSDSDMSHPMQQVFTALQQGVQSGDLTFDEADEGMRMFGEMASAAQRKRISDEGVAEIINDFRPGPNGEPSIWSTAGALNLQVDYTGDGEPDPIEEMGKHYQSRLANVAVSKEDPAEIVREYRAARGQLRSDLHMRQVWGETAQQLQAQYQPIEMLVRDPAARVAAKGILTDIGNGKYAQEFPSNPKLAREIAEEDYAQALHGFQRSTDPKTGITKYMKPEDVEADAADKAQSHARDQYLRLVGQALDEAKAAMGPAKPGEGGAARAQELKAQQDAALQRLLSLAPSNVRGVVGETQASEQFDTEGMRSQMASTMGKASPAAPAETRPTAPGAPPTWEEAPEGARTALVDFLKRAAQSDASGRSTNARQQAVQQLLQMGFDFETIPKAIRDELLQLVPKGKKKPVEGEQADAPKPGGAPETGMEGMDY